MAVIVFGVIAGALLAFGVAYWVDRHDRPVAVAHWIGAAVVLAFAIVMRVWGK